MTLGSLKSRQTPETAAYIAGVGLAMGLVYLMRAAFSLHTLSYNDK